jgi:hypothetical protein
LHEWAAANRRPIMRAMRLTSTSIASRLAAAAREAAVRGARFSAALSPALVTEELIAALPRGGRLWQSAHLFLADTRFDARGEPAAAVRARFAGLPVGPHGLHLQVADCADAFIAAAAYEQRLRGHFALRPGELPLFDLAIVRGEPQRDDSPRLAVAVFCRAAGRCHVTLTSPVIRNAKAVLIAHP